MQCPWHVLGLIPIQKGVGYSMAIKKIVMEA